MVRHIVIGRRQQGFTYIALLFWVAITGAALGAVGQVWSTAQRRDREAELLFVGEQFQTALERYGAGGRFPKQLEALLGDESALVPKRYLRKIFVDPITGSKDWDTVTLSDGQIIGVYSKSNQEPLKTQGFPAKYAGFEGKRHYSEWLFVAINAPSTTIPKQKSAPFGFGFSKLK